MRSFITRMGLCGWLITTPVLADIPETDPLIDEVIRVQLQRLDKISYHPNLLPVILQNSDYLELTPEQAELFRQWRTVHFQPMFDAMKAIVQGRAEFIEASLNPGISEDQLQASQQKLFALQEEVLAYKLSCRKNILNSFSDEQWDSLHILLSDIQTPSGD